MKEKSAEREAMKFLKSLNGYTVWNRYDAKKLAQALQGARLKQKRIDAEVAKAHAGCVDCITSFSIAKAIMRSWR